MLCRIHNPTSIYNLEIHTKGYSHIKLVIGLTNYNFVIAVHPPYVLI